MKITSNNFYSLQSSSKNQNPVSNISFDKMMKAKNKNFDSVIISSKDKALSPENFAGSVSKKISDDVRIPASQEKLDRLKSEIENGTYNVDIDEIAKRMMLY